MDNDLKKEYEALKNQLAGFRDVFQIIRNIRAQTDQEKKEELICQHVRKISEAENTALFILNRKTNQLQCSASVGKVARKYIGGFLNTGERDFLSLQEPELNSMPYNDIFVQTKQNKYEFQNKFIIILPVTAFSKVYGLLICEYDHLYSIADKDKVELIHIFLSLISPFFESNIEKQQLEEKAKSLELLYEIGSELSSVRDEDKLLSNILSLIEKYVHVDRCSLMIVDEDKKHLRIKKAFGMKDLDISKVKVPVGEGIAGYVAMANRPLLIKDISAEKHLISQVPKKENFRTNSLLSVPLVSQSEIIGVINVNNRKDGLPFSEEDKELLSKIGSEIASVLQKSYMALQLKKARELDKDIKRFMV